MAVSMHHNRLLHVSYRLRLLQSLPKQLNAGSSFLKQLKWWILRGGGGGSIYIYIYYLTSVTYYIIRYGI